MESSHRPEPEEDEEIERFWDPWGMTERELTYFVRTLLGIVGVLYLLAIYALTLS